MSRRSGVPVLALLPFALLIIACGACGESTKPPVEQALASAPAAAAAKPAENVGPHMTDHFGKVREVEEAIIRGDIEAAKAPAQWIAEHQEVAGLPEGTENYVTEMRSAAKAVAASNDIGNAAVASAKAIATCGGCHAAAKVL